ncbi:Major allergen Pru ar 1 [Capsicum baccatum]|uniref:Major allergen Pru ar 1 n=2 Tax=Capsicum TaxID=4071 RepID=A0A1U8GCN1_CAPAN|nr:pathogenesis-related protein STH-2 [Capsicum annuum]KAF3670843.1 Major allergen Pru ar 1 [Capsicum annuum]KAF3684286.1 Major allergen Pru ar 1 [Capsicum annuum]PHT55097.1 Major allergen Pru ar 1 [Capsicum baccatum]PHT85645.1 Major allergen Pru ar 1 [Capsicum annuum]
MGINTYAHESTTTVAPTRLFKALVLDSDNLIPKVMPDVKDIETVDGDETIKKMNFVEGGPIKYLKHKIHVVDEKNLVSKYSLVEGDVLGDKLESITYEVKFEASGNGGCVCKTTSEYHTKGDHVVTEEEHNVGKEKAIDLLKAVEAYLVANPSVYA